MHVHIHIYIYRDRETYIYIYIYIHMYICISMVRKLNHCDVTHTTRREPKGGLTKGGGVLTFMRFPWSMLVHLFPPALFKLRHSLGDPPLFNPPVPNKTPTAAACAVRARSNESRRCTSCVQIPMRATRVPLSAYAKSISNINSNSNITTTNNDNDDNNNIDDSNKCLGIKMSIKRALSRGGGALRGARGAGLPMW